MRLLQNGYNPRLGAQQVENGTCFVTDIELKALASLFGVSMGSLVS